MKTPSPSKPFNPHNTLELAILQSVADHNHPRRGLAVGHPFFAFATEQIDQTVVAVLDAGYVVRPTRRRYELTEDGVARLKTLRQASADAEHRYQRSIGGRRGRSNKADLAAAAKRLRTRAEAIWRKIGPQARHPDYRTKKKPAAGRCYQTALWLKGKLGKFGSPKLIRGTGDFSHHFWVRVGGTDIDITGDQYGKPKVQVGKLPYGAGSERSWPSKPAPAGHPGAMVRAEASGRANRGRANAESMFFRIDESPLDYRRGVHVRRLMVFDPGAGPADEHDRRYFGGRSEVAFVDYYKSATRIYILYATVRGDYRGQGLLRKMITEFYARRHPRTTVIDWGDIYSPAMEKLYLEYRVRDDGVWTKGRL